uniref:Uncharacterized protein n=1 Tax=Chromera velia CCMP2878 TaxID=1169474 RepID=A0A0G4HDL1_9ALVE|eukprot:Cvel_26531.t1-p1 / transcript=Cvel_26531.t1 / gene=Cvel_26531 / organism=Chromera_velia_CCMP2878 / gene_product=hypothetical protein / transcript_product=hypothetical protein / location=Cvel_scaffold3171:14837-17943(-) / protein_length=212 / sequence_SO=supercontig / SO=protein_coding / is_pseudo=false
MALHEGNVRSPLLPESSLPSFIQLQFSESQTDQEKREGDLAQSRPLLKEIDRLQDRARHKDQESSYLLHRARALTKQVQELDMAIKYVSAKQIPPLSRGPLPAYDRGSVPSPDPMIVFESRLGKAAEEAVDEALQRAAALRRERQANEEKAIREESPPRGVVVERYSIEAGSSPASPLWEDSEEEEEEDAVDEEQEVQEKKEEDKMVDSRSS